MASVNKVTLLGRLGRDPETKTTSGGTTVCRLAVATDNRVKSADGTWGKETEWHNVTLFGRTAEVADQYLRKGSEVYLEGRLKTRKYTDKNGIERWTTDIICNEMQMCGGKTSAKEEPRETHSEDYRDRPSRKVQPQQKSGEEVFSDDIPF